MLLGHRSSACPPKLGRRRVPAFYGCPPVSPSNSFKIPLSHPVTFSPTARLRKSFSCNTYESPRKCCKQKTYGKAKSFRCNIYERELYTSRTQCKPLK